MSSNAVPIKISRTWLLLDSVVRDIPADYLGGATWDNNGS
jgi:hypothetical protein